ncbi:MAG: universal stress protein [Bacteroidia bacterium]|nr:universal stress protein [Bacteroidia bacterium]
MQKDLNIRRILIPFDFSETAALSLEHAIFMAKLLKAELYLLHIVETTTFPSSISHAFSGFEKKVEEASNEKLKELADSLHREHGIQVHILTEVGKIYKKIVHTAKQAHIDLIIMGTHGAGGHSYIIGSNTTRVVQEAPCPVISVQTHAKKIGFTKIALPIDDSAESRQKVNFALEIARHYNSNVVVIGLMRNGNEDYQRKFKIKIEQVEEFLINHGVDATSIYKQGDDLAKSTLSSSTEIDADLVVIMTEQEPSITGLLMGSYATKIINGSKIPVMTIRPAEIDPERITVSF